MRGRKEMTIGRRAMRTGHLGIHRFGVDQQSCLEVIGCEEAHWKGRCDQVPSISNITYSIRGRVDELDGIF